MKKLNRRSFLKQGAVVTAGSLATRSLGLPVAFIVKARPRWQDHPFFADAKRPDVIAHRGGTGHWPGETIYAMTEAVKAGADVLEMDVFLTKGGSDKQGSFHEPELVLMHDLNVEMTTEGTRNVYEYRVDEIQQLHADYRWLPNQTKTSRSRRGTDYLSQHDYDVKVPTLEEVFKRFPKTRMVIEMKSRLLSHKPQVPSPVSRLVKLIEHYKAENRVLVASFERKFMNDFRKALPMVATSLTKSLKDLRNDEPEGPLALQVPWEAINIFPRTIKKLQSLFAIHPWTVNTESQMSKMISFGADGIITDYPCTLLDKLKRRPPDAEPCRAAGH
jgi:glycerophosphoryl diester phosphodiesterase